MESAGKYWISIYNILESTCKIVLAHPKCVKAIRGKKTDKKDAKGIADIFKENELYNAELYAHSNTPPERRSVSAEEAIFILQRQDCLVIPSAT